MRAGCPASGTDEPEALAAPDMLSIGHENHVEMAVDRVVSGCVGNLDGLPVVAGPSALDDHALRGCEHGLVAARGDVEARVERSFPRERVDAGAEAGVEQPAHRSDGR